MFFFSFHFIITPCVWIYSGFWVVTGGEVIFPCQRKKKKVVVRDVITRNPSHFVHAILLSAVYSRFNSTGPKVLNCVQNMAKSVRSKEHVNYIALSNLSSVDIEPVSTGKKIYKPWEKLYQVERLVSKRKSSNKEA